MSLYNHVDNEDAGSKAAMSQRAIAANDALRRHPWSSIRWASRMNVGPARTRHMDAVLRALREAGFAPGLRDGLERARGAV